MLSYNKNLKPYSRKLRRGLTDAELLLWSKIRGKQLKGHQFYRQKIIGDFIVDFYCPKAKLIVELDGGQHYSEDGKARDKIRDDFMAKTGQRVCRFSDSEVFQNINSVLEMIWRYL